MCFEENRKKVGEANSKDPEKVKQFKEYQRLVFNLTQRNYTKYKHLIENSSLRGKNRGYELDHMFSISDGFENNIEPEVVAHWKNLRVIPTIENLTKHTKSIITIKELESAINKENNE